MTSGAYKVLVYGYGNPGRQDDGVGVELAMIIEKECPNIQADYNYQLNVEDSLRIAEFDAVIFIDASLDAVEPFEFMKIQPSHDITFTTHSMLPNSVLSLCQELYGGCPDAFVLAVRGYEFDFAEGLSPRASRNFSKAYDFLKGLLLEPSEETLSHAAISKKI